MDIYPAGERLIEGVTSGALCKKLLLRHPAVAYMGDREELIGHVLGALKPGDVLLTLGAGDVYKVGEEILKRLKAE